MSRAATSGDEAAQQAAASRDAWTQPGPQTVVAGVHRIPLPLPMDGLRAVNVYVIEDGDGLVLIDGGWAIDVARELLERSLATLGHDLRDIRRILVTHVHRDHYTQAVAIRRAVGAQVALGVGEQDSMRELMTGRSGMLASQPARLRRLGAGALADELAAVPVDLADTLAYYEDPDVWLEPGRVELVTLALDASCSMRPTAGCCSPATMCSHISRRRSASSPTVPRSRCATTSRHSSACWRSPMRCCCRRTDRPEGAPMCGRTN